MQTYTPQMEPVGNGDWIRAEDHAAAIATARDDALREVETAISGVGLGFYDGISSDWHAYSAADVHFACLLAVSACRIGQPTPPCEVTVQEAAQVLLKSDELSQIGSLPVIEATRILQSISDTTRVVQGDALSIIRAALRALKGGE